MRILIFVLIAVCFATTFCGGCKKKEEQKLQQKTQSNFSDEPTKQKTPIIGNISDNPAFLSSSGINAKAAEVKDLDARIRPVLKKLFGDAKIIAESQSPETKVDGEVVENRFTYSVRQLLTIEDGVALHTALHDAHFGLSPRLGAKPSKGRVNVVMSLFKSTSLRSYSLVINVDTNKQQIIVESYRLGSKYDRLM